MKDLFKGWAVGLICFGAFLLSMVAGIYLGVFTVAIFTGHLPGTLCLLMGVGVMVGLPLWAGSKINRYTRWFTAE